MSQSQNQNLRFWQDVVAQLRRARYQLSGELLSACTPDQTETIADGFGLMLMAWTDLISIPLSRPQVQNLLYILEHVPVSEVVDCLKDCDSLLLDCIQQETVIPFSGFKRQIAGRHPLSVGLIAPTQGLWNELRDAEVRALPAQDLHTYFSFITRLNIRDRVDLQCQARVKFLEQEQFLSSLYYFTTDEAAIIASWFPNHISVYESIYGHWIPRHGDGSVADLQRADLTDKYLALGEDDGLTYLDQMTGGLGYPRTRKGFRRISKVQFVPKSIDKLRTICMEPASLMFYQQGFMRSIVDYMSHHRYLRRRINLEHAELNRELALRGSERGKFSTIDLSNASDSVSWRLVRQWFADTPLIDCLELTRSTHYSLDGEVRESAKFAPMGSALCFPVECIVFSAICEAAIRQSGGDPYHSSYRVYGDDIIIETRYAQAVIERLVANGFKVNMTKSYFHVTPHNFRESCGGEYLDGVAMEPIRISRKFRGCHVGSSASRYEALIDLANDSYYHLPTVRRFVVSELLDLPKQFLPLFGEEYGHGYLFSDNPTNYRNRTRWSANYQRTQVQHGCTRSPQGRIDPQNEDIRYYEWLRSMCERSITAPLSEGRTFISHSPSKRSIASDKLRNRWT